MDEIICIELCVICWYDIYGIAFSVLIHQRLEYVWWRILSTCHVYQRYITIAAYIINFIQWTMGVPHTETLE